MMESSLSKWATPKELELYALYRNKAYSQLVSRVSEAEGSWLITYYFAICLYNGLGTVADRDNGVRILRRILPLIQQNAESGNAWACNCLGAIYLRMGDSVVNRDGKVAYQWLLKGAELGHEISQLHLGNLYENGEVIDQDFAVAAEWYRRAAEQGLASAQYRLGYMLANGYGVQKDENKAVEMYRKSAEQGYEDAVKVLAMYQDVKAAEDEIVKLINEFTEKAEAGDVDYQILLAETYENGNGVAKDHAKAMMWYRKAAEQGDEVARLLVELDDMKRELRVAEGKCKQQLDVLITMAEAGNPSACWDLGEIYANGEGVEKDMAKAVKWYRMAAIFYKDKLNFNEQLLAKAEGLLRKMKDRPSK